MDIESVFAVDEKKMDGGVWQILDGTTRQAVKEEDITDECAILIASTESPAYRALLKKLLTKAQDLKGRTDLTRDEQEQVTCEAMAETIILNWKNFSIAGKAIPYSKEQAYEFLTERKWVRLADIVFDVVQDKQIFKFEREEAIVKNS